ncbi:MAG: DNA cytosine methyltransferase [Deltaproteobacteria bacterium]|nr:DNA cytosine methyltransferase [Deltaproteobacteria bacterium]
MPTIRAIDLFCGAGGSSWGARLGGAQIVAGFDASLEAGAAFQSNFPNAKFFHGRLESLDPYKLKKSLGEIDLIIASPECTNHSLAKGSARKSESSRATALQVARFAEVLAPRWIAIENVGRMRRWSKYASFVSRLKCLGYNISEQLLNAADFGVPQRRRRLFLLCDLEKEPKRVSAATTAHRHASAIIDMNGTYALSPLRKKKRAKATLQRARKAIAAVGYKKPFLLVYYGSDRAGGWQRVTATLRTITTLDRFALVKPSKGGHVMRMLQVPELKAAMGMPQAFSLGDGSRRQQIHMIGNAVCPPVMRAVVRTLIKT